MLKYDHVVSITGVSGFVGSNLARAFIRSGRNVRVFGADLEPSRRLDDLANEPDFTFQEYSVQQPLHSDLLAVDTLYHFAGIANPQVYLERPIEVMDLNLIGLRSILDRIVNIWPDGRHRPRIVYSSTSETYGLNPMVPFIEGETHHEFGTGMRWCYAQSKLVSEQYLRAFAEQGIRHTIFRFFNFVGPDIDAPGSGRVITKMVGDALRHNTITVVEPGTQTRCFTWVDDFVDALMAPTYLKKVRPGFRDQDHTINLGSDEEVSMTALAEIIARQLESQHEVVPSILLKPAGEVYGPRGYEDVQRRVPDIKLAMDVLGWEAKTPMKNFLPRIIDAVVADYKRQEQSV